MSVCLLLEGLTLIELSPFSLYNNLWILISLKFYYRNKVRPTHRTHNIKMSGPAGRQNLMVADEMFPDGPGAGVDFADVEDVRDVGGPSGLLNDLTNSDKTVHADFYNNFGDLFDDNDLP